MSEKLPLWEIRKHLANVSLAPGEQQYMSHLYCPSVTGGGADHKQRLNIRRTDDGATYLLRCNHCGRGGRHNLSAKQRVNTKKNYHTSSRDASGKLTLPKDVTHALKDFSPEGRVWCTRYGLTEGELRRHRIGFSERYNRVVLPIYREGELVSYQLRRLSDDDGAKYIGYGKPNEKWLWLKGGNKKLTLTEDYQSAVKCFRHTDSLALLSTSLGDGVINQIVDENYEEYIVFLDSDNGSVKRQERQLVRTLAMLVGEERVRYVRETDPKNLSEEVLHEKLQ